MGYWKINSNVSKGSKGLKTNTSKMTGGIATPTLVKMLIKGAIPSLKAAEFYELEPAEVMDVILEEDQLLETEDGIKNWGHMGWIYARKINSEHNDPISDLSPIGPLDPNHEEYPLVGELVILVTYDNRTYYSNKINVFNSANSNFRPNRSGNRPTELVEADGKFDHFEADINIRKLWPYEGDNIYQGRFGNSIRFGSNIVPDSHGDDGEAQNSPNIIFRTGQLLDADDFDKGEYVEELKNSPFKPVKEDINADGSSIWMTTDQSVKLDIEGSNAVNHVFMTSKQSDDQPKNGGKQIVLNSDRITFNTKQGKILGFSHDGIGFSTQKSFTVDADETLDMNVGGGSGGPGSTLAITGTTLLMTSPTNAGLSIGEDRAILSSPCPSILTLADYANITACEGAQLHLDDCAGIKDNQGSFLRVGGKALGITGYVFGRDDMGQQHLVYGEELTNILDSICNSFVELGETILNLAGIPTGAGPSGPISGGPTNTPAIEAWKAGVETIRARLCDLLMKPE